MTTEEWSLGGRDSYHDVDGHERGASDDDEVGTRIVLTAVDTMVRSRRTSRSFRFEGDERVTTEHNGGRQ